jgi:hypothetical protein
VSSSRVAERPPTATPRNRASRWTAPLLWVLALAAMVAAASYQRGTGPTYPLRGEFTAEGETHRFQLVRSATTTDDARVEIPDPGPGFSGHLAYRRFPVDEPLARMPLERDDGVLVAWLPRQPAAGKMEYHVVLDGPDGRIRVPASVELDPVLRYKDPVPAAVLVPHVLLMFLAMLVGVRAGLGAVVGRADTRRWTWTALALMTVGGMVLGPVVQKFAFGAYWTGFPLGQDLTDNKTLMMWLAWIAAVAVLGPRSATRRRARLGRGAVVLATVVMLAVYLVPHSLRGSELDYERVEAVDDPADAIRTGR